VQNTVCADITPPTVTLSGANPQTTEAGQAWINPGATAIDFVSGPISTITISPVSGVNVRQLGSQSIVYSATDAAGNTGTATRVVNVVDTLPPTLTLNGDALTAWEANTTFVDPGCTAVDQLDGPVSVSVSGLPINTNRLVNYNIVYSACDGRSPPRCASITRVVRIVQNTVPIIRLIGSSNVRVEAPATYTDQGATAYDTVDGYLNSRIVVTYTYNDGTRTVAVPSVNTRQLGTYEVIYNCNNDRGLTAVTAVRTVVVQDTQAPVLTLAGPNPFYLEGATAYVEPGYSAMDAFYGNITNSVQVSGNAFNVRSVAGTRFTITYAVTDPSNNFNAVTRTVIIRDTIPPQLYLFGNVTYFQQANTSFVDPGAYANDTLDGNLTPNITVTGVVRVNSPYLSIYRLVYSVTDRAGNSAASKTRDVVIVNYIQPVITLIQGNLVWEATQAFVDPGATAYDVIDGDITRNIVRTGFVNVTSPSPSTFVLNYNIRDSAGLDAITRTRTVVVIDSTIPTISILGNVTYYQQGAFPYVDPGATAYDSLDGSITNRIVVVNPVNTQTPVGTRFIVTYNVRDVAGNAAVQVNRTVIIIDTIPPVIQLLGNETMNWQGGVPWVEPGYAATDLLYGDMRSQVRIAGTVYMAPAGSVFTLTYTVNDPVGNAAIPVVRTVYIIDVELPVIQLFGEKEMTYESAVAWIDPGYFAHDVLDGNITDKVVISGHVDVFAASGSSFILHYNVRDRANNAAIPKLRNVTMLDTQLPNITLIGLDVVMHEGATPWVDPGVTAWDALNGDITRDVVIGGQAVDVMAPAGSNFQIDYSVVDAAGNVGRASRIVVIVDHTPPVIYLNGDFFVIHECAFPYIDAGATANDTLDGNITASIHVSGVINVMAASESVFNLTYTVSDRAGNQASALVRVIKVIDTIPPRVSVIGRVDFPAEGGAPYLDVGATSYDLLDGDLTQEIAVTVTLTLPVEPTHNSSLAPAELDSRGNLSIISTFAPLSTVYTVRYSSFDRAGNEGVAYRNVTVVNTLPPKLELLGRSVVSVRQGSEFSDPGAVAYSQYFGSVTELISLKEVTFLETRRRRDVANVNQIGLLSSNDTDSSDSSSNSSSSSASDAFRWDAILNSVGMHMVEYSVADPSNLAATPMMRTMNILAAAPQPNSPQTEQTMFETYSQITVTFDMTVTTPSGPINAIAYKASFTPVSTARNISRLLLTSRIFPTYLKCQHDVITICTMEANTLTYDQLETLRNLNETISVSWVPLPIVRYAGGFDTNPPVTPSLQDANSLLVQKGFVNPSSISCADTQCVFTANARPVKEWHERRSTATEIDELYVHPGPAPLLKRSITVTVDTSKVNITQQEVLSAVNLIGLQPNDISCEEEQGRCVLQTYDPLQPSHINLLHTVLPPGSNISRISYFLTTELQFANPSPSNSSDPTSAIFAALEAGIVPHYATCQPSTCTILTYVVVGSLQIQNLRSLVPLGEVQVQRLNHTAAPSILYGWYSNSLTIRDWSSAISALHEANITNYANLTCLPSLAQDSSEDCNFFTQQPLSDYQLFVLRGFPGVTSLTANKPVTLEDLFIQELQRTLATLTSISPNRIVITSMNPTTGQVTINILPLPFGPRLQGLNVTIYSASFTVNMSSISKQNATAILKQAGIDPIEVFVQANVVRFTTTNITAEMLARLRNNSLVISLTDPVITDPLLTHEEAADLIIDAVNNNQLTVSIGGQTYWAIPTSANTTVVLPHPHRSEPSTDSSSSAMSQALLIAVIVAGVFILIVLLVGLIIYRRRRSAVVEKSRQTSEIYSLSHSSERPSMQMGFVNPVYCNGSGDTESDENYQSVHLSSNSFMNPMYSMQSLAEHSSHSDYAVPHFVGASKGHPYSGLYGRHFSPFTLTNSPYDRTSRAYNVPVEGENDAYLQLAGQDTSTEKSSTDAYNPQDYQSAQYGYLSIEGKSPYFTYPTANGHAVYSHALYALATQTEDGNHAAYADPRNSTNAREHPYSDLNPYQPAQQSTATENESFGFEVPTDSGTTVTYASRPHFPLANHETGKSVPQEHPYSELRPFQATGQSHEHQVASFEVPTEDGSTVTYASRSPTGEPASIVQEHPYAYAQPSQTMVLSRASTDGNDGDNFDIPTEDGYTVSYSSRPTKDITFAIPTEKSEESSEYLVPNFSTGQQTRVTAKALSLPASHANVILAPE